MKFDNLVKCEPFLKRFRGLDVREEFNSLIGGAKTQIIKINNNEFNVYVNVKSNSKNTLIKNYTGSNIIKIEDNNLIYEFLFNNEKEAIKAYKHISYLWLIENIIPKQGMPPDYLFNKDEISELKEIIDSLKLGPIYNWIDFNIIKPNRWDECIVTNVNNISPKSMIVWDGDKWLIENSDEEYKPEVKFWIPWPQRISEENIDKKLGKFIALEGVEGSGKSTQIPLIKEFLNSKGINVLTTKEPGGTKIGQKIREILLDHELNEISYMTELLLYNADRSQHISQVIKPTIEQGIYVLSDRFSISTLAYQGYGREIDHDIIKGLDELSTGCMNPDLTIILDVPVRVGLDRNIKAGKKDRMEFESIEFHEKVRRGFHKIASDKNDVILINSEREPKIVFESIKKILSEYLNI